MATVFKRTRKKPIPAGAEIIAYRGRQCASWPDKRTGRKRRAPLADDGKHVLIRDDRYTIEWFDHTGKRRRKGSGTVDKDAAQQLANHLETEAMKRETGQIDTTLEGFAQQAQRPIAEQIADFRASLEAKGNTDKHVEMTDQRVRFIVEKCGATHIKHLTASAVQQAVKGVRDAGRSLETCNSYLRAIKSFSRWLWRDKRTADDALTTLEIYNAETDPRHPRRDLTPEEQVYLLPFVEGYTKPAHNLTGPDRAMVYRLALSTGFRANELRFLTRESFDLDADPPTVTVAAAYSKRRRNDVQPIRQDLADLLRPWLAERPRGKRLFSRLPRYTARMLKKDLAAARRQWIDDANTDVEREQREGSDFLRYEDSAGRFADFHATRHTYVSGIVAGGASVKEAQELARHSDPRLTIGRYSHARLHDLQGALDALPNLSLSKIHAPEPEDQRATGTDGKACCENGQQLGQQLGGKTVQNVANGGEPHSDANALESEDPDNSQIVPMSVVGNKKATSGETWRESGGHGTRTRNPIRGTSFPMRPLAIRLPSRSGFRVSRF